MISGAGSEWQGGWKLVAHSFSYRRRIQVGDVIEYGGYPYIQWKHAVDLIFHECDESFYVRCATSLLSEHKNLVKGETPPEVMI